MTEDNVRVRQAARDRLAVAAKRNRALRGTGVERRLTWHAGRDDDRAGSIYAKVGTGRLILYPPVPGGVHYASSFGPDHDNSFSGYMPGLTLEEAKLLVYHDASTYW